MRFGIRRTMLTMAAAGMLSATVLSTAGCGAFFVCQKASCPTSGTTSGSGDYVFVTNSASGTTYLDGFEISGGSLVSLSGAPYSLSYTPSAMVVSRNNNFLYVASDVGAIYGYSIGTGGALTVLNSGLALENENSIAMAVSPDGQWLASLNTNNSTFELYKMNTSSGLLTYTNLPISVVDSSTTQPTSSANYPGQELITFAPSGQFIAVAMGTAGFETFPFTTSSGATGNPQQTLPSSSSVADYCVAVDSNNNLYVAGTNTVYDYAVTSSGTYSSTAVSQLATGTGPYALALDGTSYVYAGAENSSATAIITGAATTSGKIGTPNQTLAPTNVSAIAVDSSGNYLVAAGFNATNGIQLYSISSTGSLTSISPVASNTASGTPIVIATTH